MTSSESGRIDWLLNDLVHRLAGVRYAVVLSTDGLLLGRSQHISSDDADHFCAMSSAIHSLALSAGRHFQGGDVRQAIIELDRGILFITTAGQNACLALLTTEVANMGMIAYEMNQTVERVGSVLSTPHRQTAVGETHG